MWMSLVEMKVWMRGRSESLTAFQAASMSWKCVRARPADDGPVDLAGDRLDGLEVARRGDREAGLDDVDAEARELVRDLDLLLRVQRDPGGLLAVAQRGVEDSYSVLLGAGHVVVPFRSPACVLLSVGLRLRAAATRYSPRRGRRRRRSRAEECDMSSCRHRLHRQHDLADVPALLHVAVCVGAALERERLGHDRADLAVVHPLAQRLRSSRRASRTRPTA